MEILDEEKKLYIYFAIFDFSVFKDSIPCWAY